MCYNQKNHYCEVREQAMEVTLKVVEFCDLQKRKPANGALVIVKAASGLLIPCFYIDGEFTKYRIWESGMNPEPQVGIDINSIDGWAYEIDMGEG